MRTLLSVAATAAALVVGVHAAPAGAAEVSEISMAVDRCQPALPAFDAAFRKRPLAMQNESTSPAFVTCGFTGGFSAPRLVSYVSVGLVSNATAGISVTCTLVDYQGGAGAPRYFTRTALVPPGATAEIGWDEGDNDGQRFIYPATSCNIPGGLGVAWTAMVAEPQVNG